jgi:Flp pilus assembly protein TadG
MRGLISRLARDARGVSATEFALILPLLVMFSAGTIEYSRLILATQKLQSGAFILADLTARDQELSTEQLGHIFLAIDQVTRPFDFATSGRAIVTSIGADEDDDPIVNWQCGGAGAYAATSALGTEEGGAATLPDDLVLVEGETIIAAEVFFEFEPLFGVGLAPRTIRRVAYFKPRLGDLATMDCPEDA